MDLVFSLEADYGSRTPENQRLSKPGGLVRFLFRADLGSGYSSLVVIMLRIIATSIAQAVAIVLGAKLCWYLFSHVAEHYPEFGLLLILVLYPVPIAVATALKHRALLDIIVTNLWLGWTVIGWFVVLIWACNRNVEAVAE